MKKGICHILICFISLFFISGCYSKDDISIYQLSNQSYSQMMSYIIECEGTTIVVDGGTAEDEDNLINQIKKVSDDNIVDAWFITHYHKDHTGALAEYLDSGKNEITIKEVYYNFPENSWVEEYENGRYQDLLTIKEALNKIKNKKIVYENQHVKFNDVEVDVLRTFNPEITNNAGNNSSSVYEFNVKGTSILFLGDLGEEGGQELLDINIESIRNIDYVQMAHHGQAGVTEEVYKVINPKYCLWPTTDWLWENINGDYKTDETKEWISKLNVIQNYIANDGTIRIQLD